MINNIGRYDIGLSKNKSSSFANRNDFVTLVRNPNTDIFITGETRKQEVLRKLEYSDTFEKLYSSGNKKDNQTKEIAKMLENPDFLELAFLNPKVIKASSLALSSVVENELHKAIKRGASEEELEQLTMANLAVKASIMSFQNAPVEENKKVEISRYNNSPQIAFAGIFNYGIFKKNTSKHDRAEACVNKFATAAAPTAGALAQTGVGDAIFLSMETRQMCKKIFKIYGRKGGYIATVGALSSGFVVGTNLATTVLSLAPGVGNAANATITYGLHQITGRACMAYCENASLSYDEYIDNIEAGAKFITHLKNQISLIGFGSKVVEDIAYKVCDKLLDKSN